MRTVSITIENKINKTDFNSKNQFYFDFFLLKYLPQKGIFLIKLKRNI